MEFQKASTVWPVTPRLLPAWMKVTLARMGTVLVRWPERFVGSVAADGCKCLSPSHLPSLLGERESPPVGRRPGDRSCCEAATESEPGGRPDRESRVAMPRF